MDPRDYQIEQDRDGFYVIDEEHEEVEPTRRHLTKASAEARIAEFIENDEPRPGWEAWLEAWNPAA